MAFTWSTAALAANVKACVWADSIDLFVAVGSTGSPSTHAIWTSPDGVTWTAQTTPNAHQWVALAYDGVTLVAISGGDSQGAATNVATSTNGTAWTAHTTGEDQTWASAAAGTLGEFVVVTDGIARYSTDSGATWAAATGEGAVNWTSVVYDSGHDVFVAAADEFPISTQSIMRSTSSGTTWSSVTITAAEFSSYGASNWLIAYSPTLNRLVALYSTDGGSTQRLVLTSDDGGTTWASHTLTATAGDGIVWLTVLWNSVDETFMAFAKDGTNQVATSADGITWVTQAPGFVHQWSASAYAPSIFTAVAFTLSSQNLVLVGVETPPVDPPVQTSIVPNTGVVAGGTPFTIFGTGFQDGLAITIAGVAATSVVFLSSTAATGVTGAHAAGSGAVVVTNPDAQVCSTPLTFTYFANPVIPPNTESSPPWQTPGQWALHQIDIIPTKEGPTR